MPKDTISLLVEGGKANAGPPLGPAIGPTGINVGQIVAKINEKTKDFAGMKVPVDVLVDKAAKTFDIVVGTPPTSSLIIKELGAAKGVQKTGTETAGNLSFEQVKKVARMKIDSMLSTDMESAVREVVGTCVSVGATVDGKNAREVVKLIGTEYKV